MKTTILLATFMWLSFHSFAQYSRAVYSDDSPARRHSSITKANGETMIVNIRESTNDTLRVMLIDIDENGETNKYRMFEYSPFDISTSFALSGAGANSSGEIVLCILQNESGITMDIDYLTLNPISGAFTDQYSLNGMYQRGFTRSRQKGDSLITYVAQIGSSGISRLARSLSNTVTSIESFISFGTFGASFYQNQIACELILKDSEEVIGIANLIIKRISANNYIEASYPGLTSCPAITVNTSGNIFVFNKSYGSYNLFDGNLVNIGSGNIPEAQGSPLSLAEVYALPNDEIRIWMHAGNSGKRIDLASNFTVINEKQTHNNPLGQFVLEGKQYLIGYDDNSRYSYMDTEGMRFPFDASSTTIIQDDLISPPLDFIEFGQVLTSGNIEFHSNHRGRSFVNTFSGGAGFTFKQNGLSRPLVYSSNSNILGTTINGALVGTAGTYSPTPTTGPYCDPGSYNHETMDRYNRGYYVTRAMIEQHLFEITIASPYYEMPFGIREWPAHGDVSLGQAANLANFVDQNGNGTYEPELGDYPSIYGDQCLLNIYHQSPNTPHSASIETHQYYFTFDCDSSEAIQNAVFVRTHNFARGEILFDTYEGDYIDFDVGGSADDFAGTNVELGMGYAYNGDNFDEDFVTIGFHDTIPAVGMITLQGLKLDEDGIDNTTTFPGGPAPNGIGFADAIPDNEYFTMESSYIVDQTGNVIWSLNTQKTVMQGNNPLGNPKMVGSVEVRHDYFGNSDVQFYTSNGVDHGNNHSEFASGNSTGDRRIICASGPSTFSPSDTMVFLKAFVIGVDTVNLSQGNSLQNLFDRGQELQDLYTQDVSFCGNTFDSYVSSSTLSVEEEKINQILVYPNPANQHIQFKGIVGQATLDIFDLNGRVVISGQDINDNQSIDISGLDKAIYLIQIYDENGGQTIRMIKQ